MHLEDKILLSKLDGFIDATSIFKSINRNFLCSAIVIEAVDPQSSIDGVIEKHYSDCNAKAFLMERKSDWLCWMERELDNQFQDIQELLRFELVWQQIELLRILTDGKGVKSIGKYGISMAGFSGVCYSILIKADLVLIQFLNRVDE